jgi:hypothetical protein
MPGEEELFAGFRGLETPRAEALPPDADSMTAIEPHILLLNALNNFRAASQLDGYVSMSTRDYIPGDVSASQRIEVAKTKRGANTTAARTQYDQARELLKAQDVSDEDLAELGMETFSKFATNYYGSRKHVANVAMARLIEQEAMRLRNDPEVAVSLTNRENGWRPYDPEFMDETIDRVEAIKHDQRAGFYPKTNKEKDVVLSWLDYLDDPEKPLGIVNQLREVLNASQGYSKNGKQWLGMKHGVRALESITWEVGDYLLDALTQQQALRKLQADVDQDQPPKLAFLDEFPEGHPGVTAFIRHMDIKEMLAKGSVAGLDTDPLMTREDPPRSQRPKFDAAPGKRKTIYNQYNRPDRREDVEEHIEQRLQKLTVGQLRLGLPEVLTDIGAQVVFHSRRLDDISSLLDHPRYQPIMEAVAAIRQQELDAVA